MAKKIKALICVAHPDDETIFFGGLIAQKKYEWTAVCVTNANADGQGQARMLQFRKACQKLGIKKVISLPYPDLFEQRLPTKKLIENLKMLGSFQYVFTHGPLGEYGHFHHQDVCFAVYQTFAGTAKIFSPAYNLFPSLKIQLSQSSYRLKTEILRKIYAGESMRFLGLLPATSFEGYVQLGQSEVSAIYKYITRVSALDQKKLQHYKWLSEYIQNRDYELKTRPF